MCVHMPLVNKIKENTLSSKAVSKLLTGINEMLNCSVPDILNREAKGKKKVETLCNLKPKKKHTEIKNQYRRFTVAR